MESRGPVTALLVGDSTSNVQHLKELFQEIQAPQVNILVAERVAKVQAHLFAGDVDVVLFDLGLANSNGFETFTKVRDLCKSVPIVVLSMLKDESIAMRTVQHGAQDYLVKTEIDAPLLARTMLYAIERYRLLKKVEQQARQLERDKSQARFIEIMAHELRNPMSVAKAILTLLRVHAKNGTIPPDLPERLRTVENEIDRLSDLLNAVLEAFQTQEGEFDFVWEECDLSAIILETVTPFRACQGNKHRFLVSVPEHPIFIAGDRRHLEQVIRSLFENAMKYSPNGGRIWVGCDERGESAWITVEDEGLGIPEEDLDHVFEGFYRAGNVVSQDLGGLGLGLFVGKAIVEAHDGRIWAENKPGGGARLSIELPLALVRQATASDA